MTLGGQLMEGMGLFWKLFLKSVIFFVDIQITHLKSVMKRHSEQNVLYFSKKNNAGQDLFYFIHWHLIGCEKIGYDIIG